MAQNLTQDWQRTWYSEEYQLTPESLIDRIRSQRSMDMIDTGVILSELYTNEDSKGLLKLREAVVGMEAEVGNNAEATADCKLFWLSQIANGYLTSINNISCKYIKFHALEEGAVTDFYKRVTGFDPVKALPYANVLFNRDLHPISLSKLEEM